MLCDIKDDQYLIKVWHKKCHPIILQMLKRMHITWDGFKRFFIYFKCNAKLDDFNINGKQHYVYIMDQQEQFSMSTKFEKNKEFYL